MPKSFTCPHCGHQTNVADRFAGQSGSCSACGQPISIPTLPAHPTPYPPRRSSRFGCLLNAILVLVLVAICLGLPAVFDPWVLPRGRDSARRLACESNLHQIATAIALYESDYGCFPPAWTTDDKGNRLHSWRTLVLPYLGEESLYDTIALDQPWDSPANRACHSVPLAVYQCPADSAGGLTDTSYLMLVDGEAASEAGKPRKAIEVTDGIDCTVLLVEVSGSGIHWMEPADFDRDNANSAINTAGAIRSEHADGAHVVFYDGEVDFLPDDTPGEQLRAMATPDGQEPEETYPARLSRPELSMDEG